MTAATLLAERQQVLAAVQLRLRALEQEQQQLLQNRLRLEGAVEALQTLLERSAVPEVSAAVPDADPATTALVERADTWQASPAALPWERS
jgi:hypothetical protein